MLHGRRAVSPASCLLGRTLRQNLSAKATGSGKKKPVAKAPASRQPVAANGETPASAPPQPQGTAAATSPGLSPPATSAASGTQQATPLGSRPLASSTGQAASTASVASGSATAGSGGATKGTPFPPPSDANDSRSTITVGLGLAALAAGAYYTLAAPKISVPSAPHQQLKASEGLGKQEWKVNSGSTSEALIDPAAPKAHGSQAVIINEDTSDFPDPLAKRPSQKHTSSVAEQNAKGVTPAAPKPTQHDRPEAATNGIEHSAASAHAADTGPPVPTDSEVRLARQEVPALLNEVLTGVGDSATSSSSSSQALPLISATYEGGESQEDGSQGSGTVTPMGVQAAIQNARVQQATVDQEKMQSSLLEMHKEFAKEVESLAATIAADEKLVAALKEQLKQQQVLFEDTLSLVNEKSMKDLKAAEEHFAAEKERMKQAAEGHLASRVAEVQAQEREASVKLVNSERERRIEIIDGVRQQLNVLSRAFDQRKDMERASRMSSQMACATLTLANALREGLPFELAKSALTASSKESDELLVAVVSSLPSAAASRGVPTVSQLDYELKHSITKVTNQLALVPEGGGGMLAHLAARLGSILKVSEGPASTEMPGGGAEAAIARAEAHLNAGQLSEAADSLEKGLAGSAACAAAKGWIEAVRQRAIVDQALLVLEARAAAQAAASA